VRQQGKQMRRLVRAVSLVSLVLFLLAMSSAPIAVYLPIVAKAPPSWPSLLEHRIAARVVDGDGQFYDRATGQRFTPRGATYTRLGPIQTPSGVITYHTTFQVGTYDAARAEAALHQMAWYGYNTVQVEVHGCADRCVADPTTGALSGPYLDNVADFLRRAKANGLFVMLRTDDLPHGSSYEHYLFVDHWRADIQSVNAEFLTAEGTEANRRYYQDLIQALMARGAPLCNVIGYSIRAEAFMDPTIPPFTFTSGSLTAANGQTYDLGNAQDVSRMVDDAFVYFVDQVRAAILTVDPTALVGIGFFAPQTPHPWRVGDTRLTATRGVLTRSTADFVDFHPYPGEEFTLPQFMENYGVDQPPAKVLMMSEFGADKRTYGSAARAAQSNADWQSESCDYGYDGWLWWTWDTVEQDPPLWAAVEDGFTVAEALSPHTRPDPCAPSSAPPNIALNKPVAASGTVFPANPPSAAVDGLSATWWTGGPTPQWIEIDLGADTKVAHVALLTSQTPTGYTVHRVSGRTQAGVWSLLHEFAGVTADSQTLEVTLPQPWPNIRYIRIETVDSPSWVGWREIEVFPPS
jgi:hypothetical protein